MMRAVVLMVCLSVGCWAQKPQPCSSPSQMSGGLSLSTQTDKLVALAKYTYDALGKRVRLSEFRTYDNRTFSDLDILLLYRQGVMYRINKRNRTCFKRSLVEDFQPLAIPKDASLVDQVVVGSSSALGEGVLVNTWTGELPLKKGTVRFMSTVTEYGCVPISTLFSSYRREWVAISFFNNIVGVADPQDFIPPAFCDEVTVEEEEEDHIAAFLNLF